MTILGERPIPLLYVTILVIIFNSLHAEKFSYIFFFSKSFFPENFRKHQSKKNTVCIQIRPDNVSGLIWVQTVYKKYISRLQKSPLVGKGFRKPLEYNNKNSGVFTMFLFDKVS